MAASWASLALLLALCCASASASGEAVVDRDRAELSAEAAQQFAALQRLIDAAGKVPTAAFLRQRLAKQVKDAFLRLDKAEKAKEALVTEHAALAPRGFNGVPPPLEPAFARLKAQVSATKSFGAKIAKLCSNPMGDKTDCEKKATQAVFCQLLKRKKPDLAARNCRQTDTHLLEASGPAPSAPPGDAAMAAVEAEEVPPAAPPLAPRAPEAVAPAAVPAPVAALAAEAPPASGDSGEKEGAQLEGRIDDKLGPDMGAMFRKLEDGRRGVDSQLADLRAAEAAERDPAKKAGIHADVVRLEGIEAQMASHFGTVAQLFHM